MRSHSEPVWQTAVRLGLYGGAAALLFALVGMVQTFQARAIIGGVLTLGQAFLLLTLGLSAYVAAGRVQAEGRSAMLLAGGLAGAVGSLLLALLALFMAAVPSVRTVLVSASPELLAILAFGQSAVVGAVIWIVLGAALGALVASILFLRPAVRRTVLAVIGAIMLVGLLADLLRLITSGWGGIRAVWASCHGSARRTR